MLVATLCLLVAASLLTTGCTGGTTADGESTGTVKPVGASMAGAVQKVIISRSALEARPLPWVLTTPESAVRSYLAWISYGYRIGESAVATPTMTGEQEVRFDSYNQMNLQNGKVIDQMLVSIDFGKPIVEKSRALLPAHEEWSYRYVSIAEVGKTLSGPFKASYDTTYTVLKNSKGDWQVDTVAVRAIGEVK